MILSIANIITIAAQLLQHDETLSVTYIYDKIRKYDIKNTLSVDIQLSNCTFHYEQIPFVSTIMYIYKNINGYEFRFYNNSKIFVTKNIVFNCVIELSNKIIKILCHTNIGNHINDFISFLINNWGKKFLTIYSVIDESEHVYYQGSENIIKSELENEIYPLINNLVKNNHMFKKLNSYLEFEFNEFLILIRYSKSIEIRYNKPSLLINEKVYCEYYPVNNTIIIKSIDVKEIFINALKQFFTFTNVQRIIWFNLQKINVPNTINKDCFTILPVNNTDV